MSKVLLVIGLLFLASGGGSQPAPVVHYTVPSCHGIAHVPGYEHCKR